MNIFLFIVSLVLLIGVLGLTIFVVFLVLGPIVTGFKKAPYVPSFDSYLYIMKQQLKLKKGGTILDLGCGDGKALRFFCKEFRLKGTGYDLNPFVIWYGKLCNKLLGSKHVHLIRSDFAHANLGQYDYIYVYLWPKQLETIEDRIFEHIGDHTILISNSFAFVHHCPYEEILDDAGTVIVRLYRK